MKIIAKNRTRDYYRYKTEYDKGIWLIKNERGNSKVYYQCNCYTDKHNILPLEVSKANR